MNFNFFSYRYIAEIFDGMGAKDPPPPPKKIELFRPRVNFDTKEKVELLTFVLEGHPNVLRNTDFRTVLICP